LVSRIDCNRFNALIMFGLLSFAFVASLSFIPAFGTDEWWDSNWGYRMKITLNNSDISEDLVNFPMPIVFTGAESGFWTHVKNTGADIRFIDADDSTELFFEIEHWNYTSNEMTAWVKIPHITGGSATEFILVYYGCDTADFDSYYNGNNVWDGNYRAVWHLNQTSGDYADATSNNNNLTMVSVVGRDGGAKIGSLCPTFDGNNDYLSAPSSANLNFPGDLMIEEWINTNDPSKEQTVISRNGLGQGKGWNHELYNAHNMHIQNGEASPNMEITNTNPIASASVWYHIVWVWDEDGVDKAKAYVNGVEQTTTGAMADWTDQDVPLYIGVSNVEGRYPFGGKIDEARLSNLARSPQWIKACYEYERDASKLSFGSEEEGFWPTELFVDPQLVTKTLDQVGTTFKVNVTIRTVRSLQGFDINLTWSNDLISLFDIDFESTLDYIWGAGNWFLAYNQSGPGYSEVAAASTAGSFTAQEATPLLILTFEVKYASSGETPLHFALAKLSNSGGRNIPAALTDGIYRFSLPQAKLYVDPSLVEKAPGDVNTTFGVNITVASITDLFAFDFNITWDSNLIELVSVDYETTLDALWGEDQWFVAVNQSGPGWHKLVGVSTFSGFNGTGTIARLTFQVESFYNWEAETGLRFVVAKLSNSQARLIDREVIDGTYRMGARKPTIEIRPASVVTRKLCEHFNMSITLRDAINVKDFGFRIYFNTTLLDYVNGSDVWGALGTGTLKANETDGTIEGSVGPSTPISGDHWLLNVTFHAAFRHIWKDESQVVEWENNQTGTICYLWANLSYPDHEDLHYEQGGVDQITVTELAYNFSPIQGDVDNSGDVDIIDLRTVAYYYDVKEGDPNWGYASEYDLNGDRIIDVLDLVLVNTNFGFEYDC